jgi:predicted ATP-dependent endonuclease of OLD family
MRLKSLRIENFRSIRRLDIELPQICAIVGPNNAGKSNILEAIKRVLGYDYGTRAYYFSEDDVYIREPTLNILIECGVDPPIQYKKLQNAEPIEIPQLRFNYNRYQRGDNAGNRKLDQYCLAANGKVATVQTGWKPPKWDPLIGIPQDVRDAIPLIYIGTERSLRRHLPGANNSLLQRLFVDINEQFQRPEQKITVFSRKEGKDIAVTRLERFSQLIGLAMDVLRTDQFKKLEASIKANVLEQLGLDADADSVDLFFTLARPLDFYKSMDLMLKDHDFTVSATGVGEGFQNAIVLAILRAFEETRKSGAILLIEEPEMFLHPQMQRSLYKTLRKIGATNQVIYTTHSPHFVSVPEYADVLLVRRDSLGTYTRHSSLATDLKRAEKLRKEMDPERSELFFARKLLLVEGDTEKLAFPSFAARLKLDLDRAGATIVEVQGKKNLIDFAEIATSFRIPTGIVYDKDATNFGGKEGDESEVQR